MSPHPGADRPTILLVDGDLAFVRKLSEDLQNECELRFAQNGRGALREVGARSYDAIVIAARLEGNPDGLECLRRIRERDAQVPVFLVSEVADPDIALRAGQHGASGYGCKQDDLDDLETHLREALRVRNSSRPSTAISDPGTRRGFIGASEVVQRLISDAATVARVDSAVLITGENGTGKEVLARFIHQNSTRANKNFVAINCAAIPEGLVESELFGHERGAFTGATSTRRGSFELADGGTLLLDEITEMPSSLQPKLLRALQSGEFARVGSEQLRRADARVICSSNRDLNQAVREGLLRKDLFYRINVVSLHIPPLRERKDDIPALARHFLGEKARQLGKRIEGFSREAEALLLAHDWPGNVRELENLVERAVVFTRSKEIDPGQFTTISEGAAYLTMGWEEARQRALRRFERSYLTAMLQIHRGSVIGAAAAMGISRQALYKAVERARLRVQDFRPQGSGVGGDSGDSALGAGDHAPRPGHFRDPGPRA